MRTVVGLALAVLGGLSCATSNVYVPGDTYSAEQVSRTNDEREDTLRTRAAFEMKCDALEITCLETQVDGFCVTAGVDGCEQRATYLFVQTGQFRMQWVLDAANGTQGGAAR